MPVPRRLLAALLTAAALGLAACGGASQDDVDALETRVVELEAQVEQLEAETATLRALAGRLDDIEGLLGELRDRLPELDELRDLIEGLAGIAG